MAQSRDHIRDHIRDQSFLTGLDENFLQRAKVYPNYNKEYSVLNWPWAEKSFAGDALVQERHLAHFNTAFLVYWSLVRETITRSLKCQLLQKVLYFIDDSPVLSILDDFLPQLDAFFLNQEEVLQKCVESCYQQPPPVRSGNLGIDREDPMNQDSANSKALRECLVQVSSEELALNGGPALAGVDERYVEALELSCLLRQRLMDVRHNWRSVVSKSLCDHGRYKAFAEPQRSSIAETLEVLLLLCEAVLLSLSSQEDESSRPKFTQLCQQLKLSKKETMALQFIFMSNVGVLFNKLQGRFCCLSKDGPTKQQSMSVSAAAFACMSSKELLEFMDSERAHLKQELLQPEDEFSSLQMTVLIVMPTSVLKACCGCSLGAEDRYKIDKTAMGEVMSRKREGGGGTGGVADPGTSSGTEVGVSKMEAKSGEQQEEAGGDEDELELEEILHSCTDADQGRADQDMLCSNLEVEGDVLPYSSDLEYLEDNFQLIEALGKALKMEDEDVMLFRSDQRKPEAIIREMRAKSRSLRAKINQKMEATVKLGGWLPRLERLAELRKLDQFEKNILLLLIGSMVSKNLRRTGSSSVSVFGHSLSIGSIISVFCEGLKDQIQSRTYFYKNSKLVSEGLIHISDPPLHTRGNFLDSVVELDRRLLDYIVGLDTEINELVDGSDLYTPTVKLSDVALPGDHKQLLLNTFQSFDQFQKTCKDLGLNTKGASKGLCLLFYGPSGTGKTMTANAVADHLKKKILLITLSLVIEKDLTKELLRFLFREAKIHNAILFFDECECLFETRSSRPNPNLGVLLTEIEQYSGVIILATNRHQDLDEAMHRRIQLALPFSVPDYQLREEIWRSHVPETIACKTINWSHLAAGHELTGGLICNAVLSALSLALKQSDNSDQKPVLTEDLLAQGAKLQLRGLLEMVDFERRIIPTFGVRDLVLEEKVKDKLKLVLGAGKTHKLITSQWGFRGPENVAMETGISLLICGSPGAGKTAVAKAIAYELGQPIKEATCTELLSHTVNIHSRMTRGIANFFREAERSNAIVLLDGAEILLSAVSSGLTSGLVGCEHMTLVHQVEHFSGVIILTSRQHLRQLDLEKLPRLKYVVNLSLPSATLREELWRRLLPKRAPLSSDINYVVLSERFPFNGGQIATCICQAAELCASATPPIITHDSLSVAAEFEVKRKQNQAFLSSLFS